MTYRVTITDGDGRTVADIDLPAPPFEVDAEALAIARHDALHRMNGVGPYGRWCEMTETAKRMAVNVQAAALRSLPPRQGRQEHRARRIRAGHEHAKGRSPCAR